MTAVKHKSLFQLFAEKTIAASKQAGRPLSIAIMTSPQNHDATIDFFNQHHLFGLEPGQLSFFCQGMLPLLDQEGQLFLENAFSLAEGPDGNGGALHHFYHSGIYQQWQAQGIRHINFVPIDNPLADPFDAELLGCQQRCQNEITIKCTLRRDVQEKVGLLARHDGRTIVVEYSEIPEKAPQCCPTAHCNTHAPI